MNTKKMDWKLGGQMFAMLVQFFTNISALFKRQEVGPEILDWINGPGCVFFNLKMREVAEEFRDLRIVCDIDPIRPIGMYVKENVKPGVIVWEPTNNSSLLTYVSQGEERGFAGDEIRKALMEEHGPRVMNANILFYLLDNLKRIPSCWEGKDVCFWGTVYSEGDDVEYILSLDFTDKTPCLGMHRVNEMFYLRNPAAVFLSKAS